MSDYDSILVHLREMIADTLGVPANAVAADQPFDRLGLSSRDAVMLSGDLQDWLGRELPATLLYEHPTPAQLAVFLSGIDGSGENVRTRRSTSLPAGTNTDASSSPLQLDDFEEGRV